MLAVNGLGLLTLLDDNRSNHPTIISGLTSSHHSCSSEECLENHQKLDSTCSFLWLVAGHGKTKYSEYYNTDCIDIVYLHRYKPTSQHLLDTKCFQGRYVFSTIINIFKITSLFEWSIKGYLKEIQSRKLDYLKYSSMIRKKFNC